MDFIYLSETQLHEENIKEFLDVAKNLDIPCKRFLTTLCPARGPDTRRAQLQAGARLQGLLLRPAHPRRLRGRAGEGHRVHLPQGRADFWQDSINPLMMIEMINPGRADHLVQRAPGAGRVC